MTTCHRTVDDYYNNTHQPDCTDRSCTGCVRCTHDDNGNPVTHCDHRYACTSHLNTGEYACPNCLARLRGNIKHVVDLVTLMPYAATSDGIDSEAVNIAGPAADVVLAQWARFNAAWLDGQDLKSIEEADMLHPFTCLATWERNLREALDHDAVKISSPNLVDAATYLQWVLTDLARDPDYRTSLRELAADVRRLRTHLETVLHNSHIPDQGAPCPECPSPAPKLTQEWSDAGARWDRWRCPRNRDHVWTETQYRAWVTDDYLANARWLTAADITKAHGIKAGTLRQWAARKQIHRKRTSRGLWTYNVDDALRLAGQELQA